MLKEKLSERVSTAAILASALNAVDAQIQLFIATLTRIEEDLNAVSDEIMKLKE